MKLFLMILIAASSLISSAQAGDAQKTSADGNQIAEPSLKDYAHATRTPGFSPIYAVVDRDGKAEQK